MTKTRPIIFSGPMVRAILDGRKTQTRRVIKNVPDPDWRPIGFGELEDDRQKISWGAFDDDGQGIKCPYGKPGDRLWVRETWGDLNADHPLATKHGGRTPQEGDSLVYRANPADDAQWIPGHPGAADFTWRPSIHMPRWASRITLEITDVRVERLQDISEDDAVGEGFEKLVEPVCCGNGIEDPYVGGLVCCESPDANLLADARMMFRQYFCELNGPDAWDANPWVWALTFRRVETE